MNRRAQQGLSLLELMIALTIGLGLLAGLTTVFVNSSRSHTELARASQQIENGRFAIQTLQENIWHAGYYGRKSGKGFYDYSSDPPKPTAGLI